MCEDDERYPLDKEDVTNEISHTNMLQFCQYLYDDISQNIDEWASFVSYDNSDVEEKKKTLIHKLNHLKELISEREKYFGDNRCFL